MEGDVYFLLILLLIVGHFACRAWQQYADYKIQQCDRQARLIELRERLAERELHLRLLAEINKPAAEEIKGEAGVLPAAEAKPADDGAEFTVLEPFKILYVSIPDNKQVKLKVKRVNAPQAPIFPLYGRAETDGAFSPAELKCIFNAIMEHGQIIKLRAKLYVKNSAAVKGEIIDFADAAA